jgi:hypothetical protein
MGEQKPSFWWIDKVSKSTKMLNLNKTALTGFLRAFKFGKSFTKFKNLAIQICCVMSINEAKLKWRMPSYSELSDNFSEKKYALLCSMRKQHISDVFRKC